MKANWFLHLLGFRWVHCFKPAIERGEYVMQDRHWLLMHRKISRFFFAKKPYQEKKP